jgi:23S rRNA (guanosine2251-2'-O)-methyltransferase
VVGFFGMKQKKLHIYGKQPVFEVLRSRPDLVRAVFTLGSVKSADLQGLRELSRGARIPTNSVDKKKIRQLIGEGTNHQGVVAELKSYPHYELEEWLKTVKEQENPYALLLDELTDPHNVGAILRSAAAFKCAGVLIPTSRQVPVTGAVFRASAGAAIHVPVVSIGNVNQAIEICKNNGFWSYALAADAPKSLFTYKHEAPALFIIGSEGEGVRKLTKDHCDDMFSVPMSEKVESLNASVTGALVCAEVLRQM